MRGIQEVLEASLEGSGEMWFVFGFCFWPYHVACRILVPNQGSEPVPPAVEARSLDHWIVRKSMVRVLKGFPSLT